MPKGTYGEGTVEACGRRWRVRFRVDGKLVTVASKATQEEAEIARHAFIVASADGPAQRGTTLLSYEDAFFERRTARGKRDVSNDRNIWKLHIATAKFATWPMRDVTVRDLERWLDAMLVKRVQYKYGKSRNRRYLSTSRIKNALNLIRRAFAQAIRDQIVDTNPVIDVRVPDRAEGSETTEDAWDWMRFDEQQKFAESKAVPEWARLMVLFAMGTGLRKREQWNLELRDVHADGPDPHVVVRFGGHNRRRKSAAAKETHRVPLFGWSLYAIQTWLPILKERKNSFGLLWPTPTGERWDKWGPRSNGVDLFAKWLRDAGIKRELRWHDLRHTCGSSLISGVWGDAWSLDEVQALLDHKSRSTTERYVHLAPTTLSRAAKKAFIPGLNQTVT